MSYDLNVWLARPDAVDSALAAAGFRAIDGHQELAGPNWAMTARLDAVDDDEVPGEVHNRVVGITHLVSMSLEPLSAPRAAHVAFEKLARSLAEAGAGAVEGLAAEPWVSKSARAVRKPPAVPVAGPRRVTQLALGWWFDPATFTTAESFRTLLATIERYLPEALPHRYQSYKPPRFKLAETGIEHFIRLLLENARFVLAEPARPCLVCDYPEPDLMCWLQLSGETGFKPGHLTFGFDSAILDSPEWQRRIARAWRELCAVIRPFYADIRLLDGLAVDRGRVGIFMNADQHPAHRAFWIGIPDEPALARVIGPPYANLWAGLPPPDAAGLVHLGPADWSLRQPDPTPVPADLASYPLPAPPGLISPLPRRPAVRLPFEQPV